jgi:uncharacterized metal-binding protein
MLERKDLQRFSPKGYQVVQLLGHSSLVRCSHCLTSMCFEMFPVCCKTCTIDFSTETVFLTANILPESVMLCQSELAGGVQSSLVQFKA